MPEFTPPSPEANSDLAGLRRTRLLVLTTHPGLPGPLPKHTPVLLAALRELGLHIDTEPWGARSSGESTLRKLLTRLPDLLRVRRRLAAGGFDILVLKTAHNWPALLRDVPLLLLVRRFARVIAVQFHGSFADRVVAPGNGALKAVTRWLLALADGILVLSSEERDQFAQFRPAGRYFLVANPFVPHTGSGPVPVPQATWRAQDQVPVLLFVARLMPEKGIFEVLEALALLARRGHHCRLRVAGSGPAAASARSRATDLGVAERVEWMGYVDGQDLAAVYAACDIFVFPTYWAEGYPTVLTEAMSAGLPVVTTGLRGAADHLQDGENVIFVRPHDPADVARGVESLLVDADLRLKLARGGLRKVQDFAAAPVAKAYAAALAELLATRRVPGR